MTLLDAPHYFDLVDKSISNIENILTKYSFILRNNIARFSDI